MSPTVASGVFALVGVAVGSLINYLATTAIEERKGRRALRTSARIVGEEVGTNLAIAGAAIEIGDWSPVGNAPFNLNGWPHYRQALAKRLPSKDWSELRAAMRQLQTLDRVHGLGAPDRPFTPNDIAHLSEA
jgi:hypothetical protein